MKAIVLSAGLGTRFLSSEPKVLHKILGKPMLWYVLNTLRQAKITDIAVVVGHQKEKVMNFIGDRVSYYHQENPKGGTAEAVLSALDFFRGYDGYVLITNGDSPLVSAETIKNMQRFIHMVEEYEKVSLAGVVLTAHLSDPTGYGRVVKEEGTDRILKIVEEKDASPQEKRITEVNGGVYIFRADFLISALGKIKRSEATGELYLPEVVRWLAERGEEVRSFMASEPTEILGVNNRWELAIAENIIRLKLIKSWAERGVTFHTPETIWIEPEVELSKDVEIYQGCVISGKTRINEGAKILPYSIIEDSEIANGATVGPFARIRNGTQVGSGAQIGNFVEVKNSTIGEGVRAKHLAYIGDAQIGEGTNIGAGAVTANFDGKKKHKTVIGKRAFIGSNSLLIAPIKIGDLSYVAGGSVVNKDIEPGDLALERSRLRILKGKGREKLQD